MVQGPSFLLGPFALAPLPCRVLLASAGGSRAARLDEAGEAGGARSCCAGEAVGLDVELHNPLALDLAVTRLRLACAWEPAPGGVRGPEGSPEGTQSEATQQDGFQVRRVRCPGAAPAARLPWRSGGACAVCGKRLPCHHGCPLPHRRPHPRGSRRRTRRA